VGKKWEFSPLKTLNLTFLPKMSVVYKRCGGGGLFVFAPFFVVFAVP
jgi:hypothetical protein